jgi:hypothetical protein
MPDVWSQRTLEFGEQVDTDQALSRDLETAVLRSIDANLDQSKYDVQSVKCRGNTCQILSVEQTPSAARTWPAVFVPILRDLSESSVWNSSTGTPMKPNLQSVEKRPDEPGYITMLSFN